MAGGLSALIDPFPVLEEAQQLFLGSAETQRGLPHNRAFNACVLAMISTGLGNSGEASRWLAEAERCDPPCPLLAEVRRMSAS